MLGLYHGVKEKSVNQKEIPATVFQHDAMNVLLIHRDD